MRLFHPLLIESIRDGRLPDDREIADYADAIRAEVVAEHQSAERRPLFAWARRAVEGSKLS